MIIKDVFDMKCMMVGFNCLGIQLGKVDFDFLFVLYLLDINDNSNDLGSLVE